MSYEATIYQIMIASPSDVIKERQIIRDRILEWNSINSFDKKIVLMSIGWETHTAPVMGDRPQEIINKQILNNSDLLIGIFWTRIGTPTGEAISGTVEEIEKHVKLGKPAMIYFSKVPVLPDSIDQHQYELLKNFRSQCEQKLGLIEYYNSIIDFEKKVNRQLSILINTNDYFKINSKINLAEEEIDRQIEETDEREILISELSEEARTLLMEASQDSNGQILKMSALGGTFIIQTNRNNLIRDNNAKEKAIWESALGELIANDLAKEIGYKDEMFQLTRYGYEIAEILLERYEQ